MGAFLFSFQGSVKGLRLFTETTDALGDKPVLYWQSLQLFVLT
jgi:hypothetical protein